MTSLSRIKSNSVQFGEAYQLNTVEKKIDPREQAIIEHARTQADEIVAKAQVKADAIMAKANEHAENIVASADEVIRKAHEDGYQTGYNTGYNDGYKKVHEDLEKQVKAIDVTAKAANRVRKEIIRSSEREILYLTAAIAEKILKTKIDIEPEIILNIIKAAIREIKDKDNIKVLLNPEISSYIYDFTEEIKQAVNGLDYVKILEDKTVSKNGIIIESIESRLDVGVKSQIAQITKLLINEATTNPVFDKLPPEIRRKIDEQKEQEDKQ